MDDKFLDREGEKKALDKLDQLKQKPQEKFEDFRQQFEQLSAQAGSLAHQGSSKIAIMSRAMNETLTNSLVAVETSTTNYDDFVRVVQRVATKLEALPSYNRRQKLVLRTAGNAEDQTIPSQTDNDGDIQMTNVNALTLQIAALTAQVTALTKKRVDRLEDRRPRAKWRPQDEFNELMKAGKCGRCKESKHRHPSQCKYRPAIRPDTRLAAVAIQDVDDEEKNASSESEN
jgi:hypothetical protein